MRWFTGGYTADMEGAATGIGVLVAGEVDAQDAAGPLSFTGDAVATAGSPSWLAWHPQLPVVYAAMEAAGTVQAFALSGPAALTPLGAPVSAGEAVCHVAVAPDGGSLVAACYGDGRVVRMSLDAAGRPGAPVNAAAATDPYDEDAALRSLSDAPGLDLSSGVLLGAAASGPAGDGGRPGPAGRVDDGSRFGDAGRAGDHVAADARSDAEPPASPDDGAPARVSHAHQAVFLPGGELATVDLGFDLVRFWRTTKTGLALRGQVVLPRGVGPRHLVRHPSGYLFVACELSPEAFVLGQDPAGAWSVVSGTPLSPDLGMGEFAAEITTAHDDEIVHVGVRGSNTIATLRVRDGGASLRPFAVSDAGVDWPRHHLVAGDTMLVSGQRSDDVVSLPLDERTGVPGRVRHRTAAPAPTHLLPTRV